MNATSASPANTADTADMADMATILVWDVPVRVFHWLMVLCFAGAYATAESESWRLVHVTLGYSLAGLVAFRLVWGLLGTRYARFTSFVRSPAVVIRYLGALLRHRPEHHTGHNPAGALAIVGMLALGLAITVSGWATYNDLGGNWGEELHEVLANGMLLLVGVHIAAVLVSGWLHGENLVRAMLSGYKHGEPGQGIRSTWWPLGLLLLVAVLCFWGFQLYGAPVAGAQ